MAKINKKRGKGTRTPRPKSGELKCQWGKLRGSVPDIVYAYGDGVKKADARLLHLVFSCGHVNADLTISPSFISELENRGYDIKTLKFSIQKKVSNESNHIS